MSQPGKRNDLPNAERPQSLTERIVELYSERLARLEKLKRANKVTPEDFVFLQSAGDDISACEENARKETLDEGSVAFLLQLRAAWDGASATMTDPDTEVIGGEKKKKKVEEMGGEDGDEEEEPKSLVELAKRFPKDEATQWWFGQLIALEKKVRKAEGASHGEEFGEAANDAADAAEVFLKQYNEMVKTVENMGEDVSTNETLLTLKKEWEKLDRVIQRFFSEETEQEEKVNIPELRDAFAKRIQDLANDFAYLEDMPLETLDEVAEAERIYGIVFREAKQYFSDWKKEVHEPHLSTYQAKDSRWNMWGKVPAAHGALRRRWGGIWGKNADGEKILEKPGVKQRRGQEIRERRDALRSELWNEEFPQFVLDITRSAIDLQDARLRGGAERVKLLEVVRNEAAPLLEQWEKLRVCGPRIAREERKKGAESPVRHYDVITRWLQRQLDMLSPHAERSHAAPLRRVAYDWRQILADVPQFWNEGVKHSQRIDFLRKYSSGVLTQDALKEAMEKYIPADEQENFDATAESLVLNQLRKVGADREEERAERERRERKELYHPKLEKDRLDAREVYRAALQLPFWKKETKEGQRKKLLAPDVEKLEDADLSRYVDDIPAYREAYAGIEAAYGKAKKTEDDLYLRGVEPEGTLQPMALALVFSNYRAAEADEERWYRDALNAEWKHWQEKDAKNRKRLLREAFQAYAFHGYAGIKDIPGPIRGPVIGWVLTKMRLRTIGRYTQWLLDENPALAQAIPPDSLPRAFRVQRREVLGVDEGEEVLSDAEKSMLRFPERRGGGSDDDQEEDAQDDLGGESVAPDSGREEEGEGSSGGSETVGSSETSGETRDVALDEHPREVISKLSE